MSVYVLDAHALVAFFQAEARAARLRELFEEAGDASHEFAMTAVNFGEVVYTTARLRRADTLPEVQSVVDYWQIEVVDVDVMLALAAAKIKNERHMGYLDCFVVALALARDATIVTGDPDFKRVEDIVAVEWLTRG